MVAMDVPPSVPPVMDRLARGADSIIPVCTDSLLQLEAFVTSRTQATDPRNLRNLNYTSAFTTALSLFTQAADTGEVTPPASSSRAINNPNFSSPLEKILLFLTLGNPGIIIGQLSGIQEAIVNFGNAAVSVYRATFVDIPIPSYENIASVSQ